MNVQTWVIIDIILYYLLLIFGARIFRIGNGYCRFITEYKWYNLLLGGILLFCLFDKTTGDYFHYQSIVREYLETTNPQNHLEYPYHIIIELTSANYFLFRLIVWGGALFIWNHILKILSLQNTLSLTIFILFFLFSFSCVRMSLGLVIFYLGFILFWKKFRTNIVVMFAGIMCMIVSSFFHKALFILLLLFPFTFIRLNKSLLIAMIVLFPFLLQFINTYVIELFFLDVKLDGLDYLSGEKVELGLAMKLYNLLLMMSLIIIIVMFIWNYVVKASCQLPLHFQRLLYMVIFLFYITLLTSCLNIGDNTLFARIRDMLYPPFVLLLSHYCANHKLRRFPLMFSFIAILLVDAFNLMYAYYLKTLGLGV